MHRTIHFAIALTLSLLVASAAAQTRPTGTVDATIDGETYAFSTYAMHVAADIAEDIEDEEAREFAERVAGTDQHSATWMRMDAVGPAGMEILPESVTVMVDARADPDPFADAPIFDLSVSFEAATLERIPKMGVEVVFDPTPDADDGFYSLIDGAVVVERIEPVGDTVLAFAGTVNGTLAWQESAVTDPDPSDTMPIEASFAIDEVVGSTLLMDVLID